MVIKALTIAMSLAAIIQAAGRDAASQARDAVEMQLRRLPQASGAIRFRELSVFEQFAPNTIAVCGQVSPTGAENAFIDFAAIVTTETGNGTHVRDFHLADSPDNAARTRAETFLRCTNEAMRMGMTAGADRPPAPQSSLPPPSPDGPALGAGETAVMRQGGNLRAEPNGGSTVIRSVPRGTVVHIFREAPGGWYQIGDTAPWGWMHRTMLNTAPQ
jgi:hypothetical protein